VLGNFLLKCKEELVGLRVVAILAVRNEGLYLRRCLEHLYQQGIETCVIDNDSTDDTLSIAQSFIGRGVFRIEKMPYEGFFDWTSLLNFKENLAQEIEANWFINHDADEIREAPKPFLTLKDAIKAADRAGYNAINFDEFVFVPSSNFDKYEGTDYVEKMRHYYFFEPTPLRRINAWKKSDCLIDLTSTGGHSVEFDGRNLFPQTFTLRHYIGLSADHLTAKYAERIYSETEIREKGWHKNRSLWKYGKLSLPKIQDLKTISSQSIELDKSSPSMQHLFRFDSEDIE